MKNRILFQQDVTLLVNSGLCNASDYRQHSLRTHEAFIRLESKAKRGDFPFLGAPFLSLDRMEQIRDQMTGMRMILIIGQPRSSITLRLMSGLLQSWVWVNSTWPRLCFLDGLDPEIFWEIISIADPMTTAVFIFSHSGEEESILLQMMRYLEYWSISLKAQDFRQRFVIVTSPRESTLMKISKHFGFLQLDYPESGVGHLGCFAMPFLLPLALSGFDCKKFYEGAALVCAQFFKKQLLSALEAVTLFSVGYHKYGIERQVFLGSHHAFQYFPQWAEQMRHILGYDARAFHMDQPYFATIFTEQNTPRESLDPAFWDAIPDVRILAQKSLAQWLQEQHEQDCQKIIQEKHFLRILRVKTLSEETLGALLMNHILEVLLMTELPFVSG